MPVGLPLVALPVTVALSLTESPMGTAPREPAEGLAAVDEDPLKLMGAWTIWLGLSPHARTSQMVSQLGTPSR